jgi:hypothetical protein
MCKEGGLGHIINAKMERKYILGEPLKSSTAEYRFIRAG